MKHKITFTNVNLSEYLDGYSGSRTLEYLQIRTPLPNCLEGNDSKTNGQKCRGLFLEKLGRISWYFQLEKACKLTNKCNNVELNKMKKVLWS